jgi:hypothetical protein
MVTPLKTVSDREKMRRLCSLIRPLEGIFLKYRISFGL